MIFKINFLLTLYKNCVTIYPINTERKVFMPQTILNVRIDADLKKQFDNLCSEIGMNMSTAISVFVKKAVRERRIPFELTADSEQCKNKQDASKRIGVAKDKFRVSEAFEDGDKI